MKMLILRVFNRTTGHVNVELAFGPGQIPRIRELEIEVVHYLQRHYRASRFRPADVPGSNEVVYALPPQPNAGPNDTVVGIRTIDISPLVPAREAHCMPSAIAIVDSLYKHAPFSFHNAMMAPPLDLEGR